MPKAPLSALAKAMDLLAARPLSELELLTKLRRAGYPDGEADAAIAECRKRIARSECAFNGADWMRRRSSRS